MKTKPIANFEFEKPLVCVTFTGNEFTDENFEEYSAQSKKAFEWERYGMIYDISKVEFVEEKYRMLQAQDIKDNKEKIENQAIGLAVVASSFFQRTFAKAILLFISYPSEIKVCKDKEEAIEWINELLEKENINTNTILLDKFKKVIQDCYFKVN